MQRTMAVFTSTAAPHIMTRFPYVCWINGQGHAWHLRTALGIGKHVTVLTIGCASTIQKQDYQCTCTIVAYVNHMPITYEEQSHMGLILYLPEKGKKNER